MEDLQSNSLNKLNDKEFSILLFYADGCKHCEAAKPIFNTYSELYPEIAFFTTNISSNMDYYLKYAEERQEAAYETAKAPDGTEIKNIDGNSIVNAIFQFNEDGSPKMVKKIAAPTFYVHHVKAKGDTNTFGFIGGFDGHSEVELRTICDQIRQFQ